MLPNFYSKIKAILLGAPKKSMSTLIQDWCRWWVKTETKMSQLCKWFLQKMMLLWRVNQRTQFKFRPTANKFRKFKRTNLKKNSSLALSTDPQIKSQSQKAPRLISKVWRAISNSSSKWWAKILNNCIERGKWNKRLLRRPWFCKEPTTRH